MRSRKLGALCAEGLKAKRPGAALKLGAEEGRGFLLKRILISYVFMTVAVVLISLEMKSNGSASLRNPAWVFVSHVRNAFVGLGVGTVSLFVLCWIASVVVTEFKRSAQWEKEEAECLGREEQMRVAAIERSRREFIEAAREKAKAEEERAKVQEREIAAKKQAAHREEIRRSRSAKEATDQAAKDFL